jgi:hypothetical protein
VEVVGLLLVSGIAARHVAHHDCGEIVLRQPGTEITYIHALELKGLLLG